MAHWIKVLLWGLVITLLVLLGAVTWLLNDEEFLRGEIEQIGSGWAGRKLSVGQLSLDPGSITRIHLENVRLANPAWASTPDLVSIRSLDLSFSLSDLFNRRLAIERIEIEGLLVNLEEGEQGEKSWSLGGEDSGGENGKSTFGISAKSISLSDFELTHSAPDRENPLDFSMDSVNAALGPGGRIDLSGNGAIGGNPLQVKGFAHPVHAFVEGGKIAHRLIVDLGETRLSSEGTIEDWRTGSGVQIDFRFSGPEIGWLLQQAALPQFTEGQFDARLQLQRTSDTRVDLNLEGDLGSFQAIASGSLDRFVDPSWLNLQFDLTGPDLHPLGATFGIDGFPSAPYRFEGAGKFHEQRWEVDRFDADVGNDQLRLSGLVGAPPRLGGTKLDFLARVEDVTAWKVVPGVEVLTQNTLQLEGRVFETDGLVELRDTVLTIGESSLGVDGTINPLPGYVGTELILKLDVPEPGAVLQMEKAEWLPEAPLKFEGKVKREKEGVEIRRSVFRLDDHQLDITGLLGIRPGQELAILSDWQSSLLGSEIRANVHLADANRFGQLFNWDNFPEAEVALSAAVKLGAGGLEFDINDGDSGPVKAEIEGTLPGVTSLEGARFGFNLAVPSLKVTEPFIGKARLPDLPAKVQGEARFLANTVDLENVSGEVGTAVFNLDGSLVRKPGWRLRHLNLAAEGPEFRELFVHERLEGMPGAFRLEIEILRGEESDVLNSLSLEVGSGLLELDGEVDNIFRPERYALNAIVSAPDMAEFQPFLDRYLEHEVPDQALSLSTRLSGEGRRVEFSSIRGSYGDSVVEEDAFVHFDGDSGIEGQLNFSVLDLSWLSDDPTEEVEQSMGWAETDKTASALGDQPLPTLTIGTTKLNFALDARELRLPILTLVDVQAIIAGGNGEFRMDPVTLHGRGGGQLRGSLLLHAVDKEIEAILEARAKNVRFGLALAPDQDMSTAPPWDIVIDLVAQGDSLRAMALSAYGNLQLIVGPGKAANQRLDLVFSDFLFELLNTLIPFIGETSHTNFECGVVEAEVQDGLINIDPLIAQTDKIIVTSTGTISLETEEIDMGFSSRPRKGLGISTSAVIIPFIKLGGTLSKPGISLDASSAAVSGGVAVATSGLSLLGKSLFDRYMRDSNPCGKVVEALRESSKTN